MELDGNNKLQNLPSHDSEAFIRQLIETEIFI